MEPEFVAEWTAIREKVTADLRQRRFVTLPRCRSLLQLLVLPSFADCKCWNILSCGRKGDRELIGFESVWRATRDLAAFTSPVERGRFPVPFEPTVEARCPQIPSSVLGELLQRFASVKIVPFANISHAGLDGTSFELELGGAAMSRFNWWQQLPDAWSSLGPAIDPLVAAFAQSETVPN